MDTRLILIIFVDLVLKNRFGFIFLI